MKMQKKIQFNKYQKFVAHLAWHSSYDYYVMLHFVRFLSRRKWWWLLILFLYLSILQLHEAKLVKKFYKTYDKLRIKWSWMKPNTKRKSGASWEKKMQKLCQSKKQTKNLAEEMWVISICHTFLHHFFVILASRFCSNKNYKQDFGAKQGKILFAVECETNRVT